MKHVFVTRMTDPTAFAVKGIVELFGKAFKHGVPTDPNTAISEFRNMIGSPNILVLVGWEDNEPVSLLIEMLPSSPLFRYPQIYHKYNCGSLRMRDAMYNEMVAWTRENGYNGLLIANWTGKSDELYKRGLRKVGELLKVGSVFILEFKE